MTDDMDIQRENDPVSSSVEQTNNTDADEEVQDLADLVDEASNISKTDVKKQISLLKDVLNDPKERFTPQAVTIKEGAIYALTRALCSIKEYKQVVQLITGDFQVFLDSITKAKCAKLVRQVLDIVCSLAPDELKMQEEICINIVDWTKNEKRTFLRQRVEAKLAHVWFQQDKYKEALELIDRLLRELKKLDDKQLLVETHLMESKIHFALRGVPKAKAALTASRTAANAIYVSPTLQASIDTMSGTIHTQEGDYNTAHSYFLEAFEQLDQIGQEKQAIPCLKYMMLCKILDSLNKALALSAKGTVGTKSAGKQSGVDSFGSIITNKQAVKYAGRNIEAMQSIWEAASQRSIKLLEKSLEKFHNELQNDLLIKHHLNLLKEQLLESNLIRIMEPYSCVEMDHIANLIDMPQLVVEKKLSQMILDGKFQGILDQGKGQLIVYEESTKDIAMEKGLQVIANMDDVVSSLFERSKALRTMMM